MTEQHPKRFVALLALAAFLAGAAAGSLGTLRLAGADAASGAPRARRGAERVIESIVQSVGLGKEDEARVRAIFEARRPRYETLIDRIRPELDALRAETRAEVRAALPPEKHAAFDRWAAEEDARK